MKIARAGLGRALDQPDPAVRFYLFHGADEAGSRALAERLLKGLDSEKSVLAGASLKADPAGLAAEAGAISMFGGRRAIWIEPAGDEIADAVAALLEAPACENPVIAVAGALRKTSALLKLADGDPARAEQRVRIVLVEHDPAEVGGRQPGNGSQTANRVDGVEWRLHDLRGQRLERGGEGQRESEQWSHENSGSEGLSREKAAVRMTHSGARFLPRGPEDF